MAIFHSFAIYKFTCAFQKRISKKHLKILYVQIIGMMFYELLTKRSSVLLSELCSSNGVHIHCKNLKIAYQQKNDRTVFDIYPLLLGLNAAITASLDDCALIFDKCSKDIFQSKSFAKDVDHNALISKQLRELDENIGRFLSAQTQGGGNSKLQFNSPEAKEPQVPPRVLRIHDAKLTDKLNDLATKRNAADSVLLERIGELQTSLQAELKVVMEIREDANYNSTHESITQFISIFTLISDTLHYHPSDTKEDSYHNLVESCEDFLENIKQSLTLLGVTIINDVGMTFDAEKHKLARDGRPFRGARISKVLNIGFAYKNKVLQKAEVEITEA